MSNAPATHSAPPAASGIATGLVAGAIILLARVVTAVRGIFAGIEPDATQRVYFANHSSHGDFILIWTVLPPRLRAMTRPVAASEYWTASRLRSFIGRDVFNAVLIDRDPALREHSPVEQMAAGLEQGFSLIVFPEGTRNVTEERLLPFKSGLYHLAKAQPDVDLVPVWIDNLNRVLPKGGLVPVPLVCTVTFGAPLRLTEGEAKESFLERTRSALLVLAPKKDKEAS